MTMPDNSEHKVASFTLAIIAGGKSTRMGENKALLEFGGQTLIQRILDRTRDLGQQKTLIITNTPDVYAHLGLPMYTDVVPDSGSLGGIYTALYHSRTTHTIVLACDMPFISADVLRFMMSHADDADVVVPTIDGYPQGLHAIYSSACLQPIRQRIEQKRLKVIGFYDQVHVVMLDETEISIYDPDGVALMNVNTPDELASARACLTEQTQS